MANTIKQLLKNPGVFINAFLGDFKILVELKNPWLNQAIATVIFEKMRRWGSNELLPEDVYYNVTDNKGSVYKEFMHAGLGNLFAKGQNETSLVKNFIYKLNSIPMSETNSWIEYQKMVDLFYKMVDVSVFTSATYFECLDPDNPDCNEFTNPAPDQIGLVNLPKERGEGTPFTMSTLVRGTGAVAQEEQIEFTMGAPKQPCFKTVNGVQVPVDCFPFKPVTKSSANLPSDLNNTYFVFWTDGATDTATVFWYDYLATGVQPTFTGAGVVNYVPIAIDADDETMEAIQIKTNAAVVGTTDFTLDRACPPAVYPLQPCLKNATPVSVYKAATLSVRPESVNGDGGYLHLSTDVFASDGTLLASNVVGPKAHVDVHNNVRRAYEMNVLGKDVMYFKIVENPEYTELVGASQGWLECWLDAQDKPCGGSTPDYIDCNCEPCCIASFIILQTPFEANIDALPYNKPAGGAINTTGRNRILFR